MTRSIILHVAVSARFWLSRSAVELHKDWRHHAESDSRQPGNAIARGLLMTAIRGPF
jgi:hypothetical protein